MGFGSIWHWLIVIAVIAVLFGGRGKLSSVMGDFAKGIKAFKSGMKEEDTVDTGATPPQVNAQGAIVSPRVGEPVQKSG
ncbi:MAG TPA: twin-arginine translocase TatA/TatE family subunit [Stellaceae bacterium]